MRQALKLPRYTLRALEICLTLALCCPAASPLDPSRSPSQYGHNTWRIQDGYLPGLPEVVTQTTDGYLWIGTYAGLVRFDGVRFVPWASLSDKQLPDYRIWSLLGTKDGSLWIGTGKGLARWKAGELTNFPDPHGRINSILEDTDGNIWIARTQITDSRGPLCRITGNAPRCFDQADGIPLPSAMRLAKDNSGNIWVSGNEGLCRWKPGASTTYFQEELHQHGFLLGVIALVAGRDGDLWISLEQSGGSLELEHSIHGSWKHQALPGVRVADQGISALFEDRDGALWVGTARHGIYRIFHDRTDHFGSADGLSGDAIAGFFQDREGTLWVASSKGIDSFRDLPVVSFSTKEGLSGDSVSTVLAGRDGTVWIGNSGALDFLKQNKLSSIRTKHGLPGRDVTTMFEDHAGRLWVGIDRGLFVLDHGSFRSIRGPDGKPLGVTYGVTEDTKNNIWIRADKKLIRVDNLKVREEIAEPQISKSFSIAADPMDGIWLGFVNGDLARFRNDRMEIFPADLNLSTAKIGKVLPESDGSVWGVTERGLVWWKDQKRAVLTARDGLPCDDLYTAVKDQQGTFWFYARCGLFSVTASEMKKWQFDTASSVNVETFDVYDGVQPGPTPLQPQGTLSRDGQLWFANDSILQTIDPTALRRNVLPPNVLVERTVADGATYSPEYEFRLPALTRNLEIDYTALSFVSPQKVRFRYKLEGHDTEWQDVQVRRQAFYSDLPPGKYRFRVIACNNDGLWNEAGSTVEFSLAPAFFQTASFLVVCSGIFIGALWLIYLLRMRQVASGLRARMEERLGERERIARDLHDTLLQSVQGLILKFHAIAKQMPNEQPVHEAMEKALDRADQVLNEGRDRVRKLRDTSESITNLSAALRLVAEESPQPSEMAVRVVVEGNERNLHPVVLEESYSIGREALINALTHSGGLRIEVEISYDPKQFRLRVRDDGCGIHPAILEKGGRTDHWGLQGMRERARRIGAQLDLWSRPGTGTEVELKVPAVTAYRTLGAKQKWSWFRRTSGFDW